MKRFEISTFQRIAMKTEHRAVQGAIAVIANAKLGVTVKDPEGIFKTEGGVVVNGREICIRKDYVQDDWVRSQEPTPEEEATCEAIAEVAVISINQGLSEFPEVDRIFDPLRSLFE